jgi:bifunctional non-homologous end joining protein LigD
MIARQDASVAWPIAPMKAVTGRLPGGEGWWYEPKWDGHRAIVRIAGGTIDVVSSTGKVRTGQWPWLEATLRRVVSPGRDVVLDGEVIAFGEDGRHSFQAVNRPDRDHAYVVFDLLALDGESILQRPWRERRELLTAVVTPSGPVMVTPVSDDADSMVAATKAQRFEGVVAKRADSTYQPGRRSPSWVKIKYRGEQEMVVGGYKAGEGARASTFGSLLVGVHDDAGALQFVAAVGTGYDDRTLAEVMARLRPLATDVCPFAAVPKLPGRPVLRWLRPELVVQVAFHEWTDGGGVRAPVFLGFRDDKDPREVVRET